MPYTLFNKVICRYKGDVLVEDQMLEKAVEDVQLIRNVMDRSTDSLYLMYRVFIWWGAAFAAVGVICNLLSLFGLSFFDALVKAPLMAVVPQLAVGISAVVIFFMFRKGMQDKGLNRQFMVLWLAIFLYDEIMSSAIFLMDWSELRLTLPRANMYGYFVPGIGLITIALGMFCMCVFTRVKPLGWLALTSLLLSLAPNLIPGTYVVVNAAVLDSLVSPLTLLAVGIFLRTRSQQKITLTL